MLYCKTRKHQVAEFIKRANLPLKTRAEKARFRNAMRDACMVGACEERHRCLKIVNTYGATPIASEIVAVGVLKVLGFEQ